MINESDLTYENIKEFVEYTENFFRGIDVGLIEGMIDILEHAYQTIKSDGPYLSDTSTHKQVFTQNKQVEVIEEFYSTLSPTLGEMAHNLLRRSTFMFDPKSLEDSNVDEFVLTGSCESTITAVHEIAHKFTIPGGPNDMQTPITRLVFAEMETIYAELLCTDFLQSKYNFNANLIEFRLGSLQNIHSEYCDFNLSKIEVLKALTKYYKFIRATPLTEDNLSEYITEIKGLDKQIMNIKSNSFFSNNLFNRSIDFDGEKLVEGKFTSFNSFTDGVFINHQVSFLIDCYLHQSVNMENPEEARRVFETLVKINSYHGDFEPEQIDLIIKLGLPFKEVDGRLSMDQDDISKINLAFDKMYEQYNEQKKSIQEESSEVTDKIKQAITSAPIEKKEEAAKRCSTDIVAYTTKQKMH